jgi:hypothetical protein
MALVTLTHMAPDGMPGMLSRATHAGAVPERLVTP